MKDVQPIRVVLFDVELEVDCPRSGCSNSELERTGWMSQSQSKTRAGQNETYSIEEPTAPSSILHGKECEADKYLGSRPELALKDSQT